MKLLDRETAEAELLELLEQEDRERVSPRLERFREHWRIKGARGGRGAGAKSWSLISLIVQRAERECLRVGCFREIQLSLEESVYELVKKTVGRLGYRGWRFTREYISSPVGSKFIFRGLKDMRAAEQAKSLEDFDIFLLEEAATISKESLDILIPSLRKPGSELWFCYNPQDDVDPIAEKIWNRNRDDALLIELRPGAEDNPWWTAELQKEMDEDFKADPDEAEHIWFGQPRKQGQHSVMARVKIRAAMDRRIEPVGEIEIGVDVARFGEDKTVMFKRHGMKVLDWKEFSKQDTVRTSNEVWDFCGRDRSVLIKVDDDGIGGAVSDFLRVQFGANVLAVRNGMPADDEDKYTTCADEQWFGFPVDEAEIPDDAELMKQLSTRLYDYTNKGQRKIEPKKKYKERNGKSPDRADSLLLCFYSPRNRVIISEQDRAEIGARYN